jgi:hypothetical protein
MVQAARVVTRTSAKAARCPGLGESELKLVNVARASLKQLRVIIRIICASAVCASGQKSREALYVRKLGAQPIRRMRRIRLISKPVLPQPWPTSLST